MLDTEGGDVASEREPQRPSHISTLRSSSQTVAAPGFSLDMGQVWSQRLLNLMSPPSRCLTFSCFFPSPAQQTSSRKREMHGICTGFDAN